MYRILFWYFTLDYTVNLLVRLITLFVVYKVNVQKFVSRIIFKNDVWLKEPTRFACNSNPAHPPAETHHSRCTKIIVCIEKGFFTVA